jgi:hypothetical protein
MDGVLSNFISKILASGFSTFTGANTERSIVAIVSNHSFLIVRLRSSETYSSAVNVIHDTVAKYYTKSWCCSTCRILIERQRCQTQYCYSTPEFTQPRPNSSVHAL